MESSKFDKLFPLKSIEDVISLFKHELSVEFEPDLALLSIVIGQIECSLTKTAAQNTFPIVEWETVEDLYKKFKTIISIAAPVTNNNVSHKKSRNATTTNTTNKTDALKYANREIIKRVSDIIWNSLQRSSYKDRAHLQSLYSYLVTNKLDCFGVAFAVVAGCQILGYKDVHLAISEDHVWVVFGKTGDETVEVTWHGKLAEDKRGQSVCPGVEAQTWLYLAGNPVVCTRYTEVASIVSAINPSLSPTSVCSEVADMQQQLLWLLYDFGHLKNYPMGLGCLGELEEGHPTISRNITCEQLYEESINSAVVYYKNHHVYPYTYKGAYYYRQEKYREAFNAWADAGDVIRLYNYSRDDEEIYKEFLDIANELIPQIMKTESSGHSAKSILRDPQCFANLLRFYDGICQWEEGSQTPILHIGWAKHLVYTISKFDYDIRSQVIIKLEQKGDDNNNRKIIEEKSIENGHQTEGKKISDSKEKIVTTNGTTTTNNNNINNNNTETKSNEFHSTLPTLEELTVACGEKILNPDFLLHGGGVPFTDTNVDKDLNGTFLKKEEPIGKFEDIQIKDEKLSLKEEVFSPAGRSETSEFSELTEEKNDDLLDKDQSNDSNNNGKTDVYDEYEILMPKRPVITLTSQKMKGLKDLLIAEKLNTNAISLQITAQSQVHVGKKSRSSLLGDDSHELHQRSKRSRRE